MSVTEIILTDKQTHGLFLKAVRFFPRLPHFETLENEM